MNPALVVATVLALAATVEGHGRLVVPPHRGHIARLPQFSKLVPTDWSDNGLNAGGVAQTSGGLHGVCGDPYSQASPREHENGGIFGLFPTHGANVVGACYPPGATVDIKVQVTANHMGFFEFGLCKLTRPTDVETEDCFQPLAQPNGQQKWSVPSGNQFFDLKYVLPKNVTCEGDSHCVLRWHYTGGNNWGQGVWGQEHFWNCADIFVSNTCNALPPSPTTPSPVNTTVVPTKRPTTTPGTSNKCNGLRNVCYWPDNKQVIPYTKSECASFPSFVWCD